VSGLSYAPPGSCASVRGGLTRPTGKYDACVWGSGKLSAPTVSIGAPALLADPLLAAVLGLALGVGLLFASRRASRLITPDDPAIGMAKVLVANAAVMCAALASLAAYYVFARAALSFFGIALVAGFLVSASVELFRFGGLATGVTRRR
jgi:hypothetical protein